MKKQLLKILRDDISKGDITTALIKPKICSAKIILQENAYVSGLEEARFLFNYLGVKAFPKMKDGSFAKKGKIIMVLQGKNTSILQAERTVLNVLSRMSAVTTACAKAKKLSKSAKIAITRKTMPAFNLFDKKAAKLAGVWQHRMNLNEAVLLKDNHLAFFKNSADAVKAARKKYNRKKIIEIEVENLRDALNAASAKPDMMLLDNFKLKKAKNVVRELRKIYKGKIELSGGITFENLAKYSRAGADIISMGCPTTNAKGINFSLRVIGQ